MESFQCKLVQTYSCSHNSFSKPQQVVVYIPLHSGSAVMFLVVCIHFIQFF
jgi:hypothetical protein